ncbi:gag-pol polyprotein [Drepanopeziza brunnea f. sp. 'multigermtubi' MB_m1]|uniref:Gag-pol polyprotein n=1 Tax=Marssonina brunnea f. sp. multigermtubi (strain MB_m1) TaxID=1072389 RepID=K1WTE7_MARBU|nr:gag-pol polyprotein [Drepanopeziza brunnea f. sp. 'multigermtubi' MB_m1]EKD16341.1 gag-pol polyprotein [Drepanopeziza brunnea f. sp. 'multigermtubi' MB_m1]
MPFESRRSDNLRFYLSWPSSERNHAALKDQDGALRSLAKENVYDTESFAKDGHLYTKRTIKAKSLRIMLKLLSEQMVHYNEKKEKKIQADHCLLQQKDSDKKRYLIKFENGLWNLAESKYDATKRKCRGALKAMKKMKSELYEVHFILETDAKVLIDQLNGLASDLLKAFVTN